MKNILLILVSVLLPFAVNCQITDTQIRGNSTSGDDNIIYTFDIDSVSMNDTMFFYHNTYQDDVLVNVDTTFYLRYTSDQTLIQNIECYQSYDTIALRLNSQGVSASPSPYTNSNPSFLAKEITIIDSIYLHMNNNSNFGGGTEMQINEGGTSNTIVTSDNTEPYATLAVQDSLKFGFKNTNVVIQKNEYVDLFLTFGGLASFYVGTDISDQNFVRNNASGLEAADASYSLVGSEVIPSDLYTVTTFLDGNVTIINQTSGLVVEELNADWTLCSTQEIQYNQSKIITPLTDTSALICDTLFSNTGFEVDCDTIFFSSFTPQSSFANTGTNDPTVTITDHAYRTGYTSFGVDTPTPATGSIADFKGNVDILSSGNTSADHAFRIRRLGFAPLLYARNDGFIGVGHESPDAILHTRIISNGARETGLMISNDGGGVNTAIGIDFAPFSTANVVGARIDAIRINGGNFDTDLSFMVHGGSLGSFSEKMRITDQGDLKLNFYGTGIKSSTAVGVADSGYYSKFGTDGTLVESELKNRIWDTATRPTGNLLEEGIMGINTDLGVDGGFEIYHLGIWRTIQTW